MSFHHHIDHYSQDRIIRKLEEEQQITDVAKEFNFAQNVVSQLLRFFKNFKCAEVNEGGQFCNSIRQITCTMFYRNKYWRITAIEVCNQF